MITENFKEKLEIYSKIQEFDKIILDIEKFISRVENEGAHIGISMYIKDPFSQNDYAKAQQQETTSLSSIFNSIVNPNQNQGPVKKRFHEISLEISDIFVYQIMGRIYEESKIERERLINKFERL